MMQYLDRNFRAGGGPGGPGLSRDPRVSSNPRNYNTQRRGQRR